jgi:2-keto-4-pentenoate hydratase/2-oxohepta-3-ene-1,7-dioic acid hydratase in catechol pathway
MKLCRFQPLEFSSQDVGRTETRIQPQARAGVIEGGMIHEIAGSLVDPRERTGKIWPVENVNLLPPSEPGKIVCIGRNYKDHADELGHKVPQEPLIFLKPPSSVIAPEVPIVMPPSSERVDYEGELAVVIGRRLSRPAAGEDVRPYILGYTCLNDVTARDLQMRDVQFTRAKGFDTFCPIGPVLVTDLDPTTTTLETFVNGIKKQDGHTSKMLFSVDVIIRWIAQVMTLEPGDVIATGTPAGVGPLASGDIVEVVVGGIGTLRNPVAGREAVFDP